MTVKRIHFLEKFPGLPIYEMQDGTIRIPLALTKGGSMFWYSESEVTKGVSDTKRLMILRAPFADAKNEIIKAKQKELAKAN